MSTSIEQPNNVPVNGRDTPTSRPSLPRSNSTTSTPSWYKNASVESFRSPRTSIIPMPLLRKRHSTYVLSTPPDRANTPLPIPGTPPKRPIRNPARVVTPTSAPLSKQNHYSKSSSSTATGAREEITPWEFQPGPVYDEPSQVSPVASSSGSPSSTQPRRFLATGPVSEVTPWEMYPVRRSATSRSSLTTGFVEEVMPWELHPVPTVMPNRSTLATGPVEDVIPWELGPTPSTASTLTESSSTISEKRSSTRGSTSSNQGKSLSEITRLRRRKSTSAKAPKTRSTFFGSSLHPDVASRSRVPLTESVQSSTKSAPKLTHTTSSQSPLPPLTPPNGHDPRTTAPEQKLNFSIADRTIFQELKRNLEARDAQFVIKGEGSSLGSPLTCRGKKHHAFPSERAPYPRSYEHEVIDLDVWETTACQNTCESLTWHVFETPPTKVLDLGCGTGTWILNCARAWKNCQFVGLDIVPLQPDLHQVGSSDLASRITWVHTNFLEGLPFPDGEFDFVHIKRIALGVPEDKWDGLFQEITRVMKPGGAFEMLEEDLFFPGKLMDSDNNSHNLDQIFKNFGSALEPGELVVKDSEPDNDLENRSLLLSSHRGFTQSHSDTNLESPIGSKAPSFRSNGHSPPTPTTATFPATPSRSNSPVADIVINEDMEKEAREILSQAIGDDYILPLEEFSSYDQALNDTLPSATVRRHLQIKTPQSAFANSIVSLNPSSAGSVVTPDSETGFECKARTRSRAHSLSTFLSVSAASFERQQSILSVTPTPENKSTSPPVPLLLRTIPKPPPNPRDHSLLEAIYTRLLESRFINMSPLALLANYVGFYFKDVRTHPPLQYHFPAISRENHFSSYDREGNGKDSELEGLSSDDTDDDARDAILPSPVSRTPRSKRSRRFPMQNRQEDDVPIGAQGVVHRFAPYITLDETRASALSPSIKGMFPDNSSARLQRGSFLPNTIMNLGLKTLNLHLALRAAEIVACSETMWEWVQKFIAEVKARRQCEAANKAGSRTYRSGSGSIEMPARRSTVSATTSSSDSFESSILDLTREEFDGLINRFEMDMRNNCDIKNALGERFSWLAPATASQEQEAFEKACEKWDKWEQEHLATMPSHVRSHHQPRPSPPTGMYFTAHHRSVAEDNHNQGRLVSNEKHISTSSPVSSLPIRRLSRAMRVFVAWKLNDIPFEDS